MDPIEFYKRQISLTEWLENIAHEDLETHRREDYDKRERLSKLNAVIGLPFDRPVQFNAEDVAVRTPEFQKFLQEHGTELCAIRLNPTREGVSKLRMRGKSIAEATDWFDLQSVDPRDYRVDFVPHPSMHMWSTIFVVNEKGVFGEIIQDSHETLTSGLYGENRPMLFSKLWGGDWQILGQSSGAMQHLEAALSLLHVKDSILRDRLSSDLDARFANDHLVGYFETVESERGLWFIDYNRLIGNLYQDVPITGPQPNNEELLQGKTGSPGKVSGRVRIIVAEQVERSSIADSEILVCDMTTPQYVPLMMKAAGIVTDRGGILSHAAIVARELKKPCIIGTKIATQVLHDGDLVEVDTNNGVVRILERANG